MKLFVYSGLAVVLLAGVPAQAGDVNFKPIDTKKLVVQPSKTAANLAAASINLVGQAAGNTLESNGYIKTINNVFGIKRTSPKIQNGRSPLPSPNLFKSTQYKNYNMPVMPTYQARR